MKKKMSLSVGAFVGFLIFGAVIGYLGMRFGRGLLPHVPGSKAWGLVALGTLPIVWLFAVGFHELGHLVGGWVGGGKFLLWAVGPFMLRRSPSGIRFTWNRSLNVAGGLAACLPLDSAKATPHRAAVMVAGGPVASLVLLVAAAWLAAGLTAAPPSTANALAQHVALNTAVISFVIFLATAAPSVMGGYKSDGKRFFDLLRGGRRSEQEAAMLALTTAGLSGARPADYDPALIEQVVSLGDGSLFDLYGHLTAFYYAADSGEWAAAQRHLDYLVAGEEKVQGYVRDVVRCEYAWLIAERTDDVVAARTWLESAGKLEIDPATRLRAEAAVLLAEGRRAEAAAAARAGLHALEHKSLSPVKSVFAAEALERILARSGG